MPNRLINETSPYLLQHAHNPVDWYPYGEEAFAAARGSNRPLLISIGYSACHWCHVMEHESFSKPEIAAEMNRLFVCVKVDREERPDVDLMYMSAVQLLHNSGGWPLNCFALPDGSPFWGGTYFRPAQWTDLLNQISDLYHNNHSDLTLQAERLREGISGMNMVEIPANPVSLKRALIDEAFEQLAMRFDSENGGMTGAPKFPMPVVWQFALDYYNETGHQQALEQVLNTLRAMARGGIYDQIGGGFARYSTDAHWKVPHFEKMLYDNAQLVSLYAEAYRISDDESLLDTIRQTLAFTERELTSPEGAFYAALDADSEGEEGRYYVWTRDEITNIVPEYADLLSDYWGVDKEGRWENGRNILLRPLTDEVFASRQHLSAEELKQLVRMAGSRLLKERNTRIRPGLDDKILLSWNSLMIEAYVDAYRVTLHQPWLETALKAARFIEKKMVLADGSLLRTWKNGKARIAGVLNDYANLSSAYIALYQVTFDENWLHAAKRLASIVINNFSEKESPLFWFSSDNSDPSCTGIIRIKETSDGAEPSGNAVMSKVLLYLGHYFNDAAMLGRAEEMVQLMQSRIVSYPQAYACWASSALLLSSGIHTLAITGPDAYTYVRSLFKKTRSATLLAATTCDSPLPVFENRIREGETLIYQCIGSVCKAPVAKPEQLKL